MCTGGWIQEEVVKRNVDHKVKTVNFFVQVLQALMMTPPVLILSNYNNDGSAEAPHSTWVLLEEKNAGGRQGWSGQSLLDF